VAKKLKLNIGAKKSAPSEDTGASAESLADGNLGKVIKDSAQEIWLAGLGAYSRAQDEGSKVFEDRVARALNRLGVPRAEEIKELSRRITELNASVQTLLAKQKTAAKRPSAKKLSPSPAIRQTGNVKKPAQPTVRKAAKQQSE
jgi:polyhydroxyalkanoate synthesis regulator phasin